MSRTRLAYDVVLQDAPCDEDPFWQGMPPSRRILQRGLFALRGPRFVAAVEFAKHPEGVDHFVTPGKTWWRNGLDGKTWLHEAFTVFPSLRCARAALEPFLHTLRVVRVYRAVTDARNRQIRLVLADYGERRASSASPGAPARSPESACVSPRHGA